MEERLGCIYEITCTANGKGYVGQTIRGVLVRWAGHVRCSKSGNRRPLYRAMRKYGLDAFTLQVLHVCPVSELNAAERRYIRMRKTFIDDGWGYNLTTGGGHYEMSKATRRKIAKKARAQFASVEAREAASLVAIQRYAERPELRGLIGAASRGRQTSSLTKRRLSAASRSYYASESARLRQCELSKAAWVRRYAEGRARMPESVRARLSAAAKRRYAEGRGLVVTDELRAKRSAAAKARWANSEKRKLLLEKLRAGQKRRWSDPAAHTAHSESIKRAWSAPETRVSLGAARRKEALARG